MRARGDGGCLGRRGDEINARLEGSAALQLTLLTDL